MATKSFADAPRYIATIDDDFLFGVQIGQLTGQDGLAQMKSIDGKKLKSYVLSQLGLILNFRGSETAQIPSDLAVNDFFYASESFVDANSTVYDVEGNASHNFYAYHFYAWNGTAWFDITKAILENYPVDQTIESIESRVTVNEANIHTLQERVAVLTASSVFKGKVASYANLPVNPSDMDKYWVEDEACYYVWSADANQWIKLTDSHDVYDGLDSTSTTNALSANAGHRLKQQIGDIDFLQEEPNSNVVFEGDQSKTWGEQTFPSIPTELNDGVFLCLADSKPTSSSASGLKGQFYADGDDLYICIADNTWRKVALTTF